MEQTLRTVLIVTLAVAASGGAQGGAAAVYKKQLDDLHVQYSSFVRKAEALDPTDGRAALALGQEEFALIKLVHHLEEVAEEADLNDRQAGKPVNRGLRLIAQSCEGMGYVLTALTAYIDTGDRIFLSLARDGDALVTASRKGL